MIDFPPDIAARMRQGQIELCQIQFINIELVRQQSGKQWETLKTKIFDIGAFFIEKRVNAQDVVLRCKDGFIVIFADANPPPPAERAQTLSLHMNEFFVGEEAFRALQVKCNHLKLEPRELAAFLTRQGAEIEDAAPAPPIPSPEPELEAHDPLDGAEAIFEPVWDQRLGVVTTNMVLARGRHPQTGQPLRGRQLCQGEDRRRLQASYDCFVLDRTIAEMAAMREAHRPAAFSVPVHLQTVARREARMAYFDRLRRLAEPVRRCLFFYVDGISAGTPISQIEDTFGTLRSFGAGTMAVLEFGDCDLRRFSGVELRLVGWAGPGRKRNEALTPSQLAEIRRLAAVARDGKIRTFMTQVSSLAMLDQCIEAGIHFLTGSVIGDAQTGASPPHALSRDEIATRATEVYEI